MDTGEVGGISGSEKWKCKRKRREDERYEGYEGGAPKGMRNVWWLKE